MDRQLSKEKVMPPPEGALRGEARGRAGERRVSPWDWASGPLSSLPVPLLILKVLALQGGSLPNRDEPPADPQECVT